MTRHSAVPPPVTAVLDASSRWLPARLGEVEELLRGSIAEHGETLAADAGATLAAGGKRSSGFGGCSGAVAGAVEGGGVADQRVGTLGGLGT